MCCIQKLSEILPLYPNRQAFDSDDALALNMQQAIISTKNGPMYWHIYVSLGLDDFFPFMGIFIVKIGWYTIEASLYWSMAQIP